MHASTLEEFEREYSDFQDSALYLTGQKERNARLGFVRKIEAMLDRYPDSADLYHKLGLCLYDLSHWEEGDNNAIEIAFHRALLLDQDSVFSRLFLTFFISISPSITYHFNVVKHCCLTFP
ncbi:MAG: tetratricopeptide repeat protein [Candidatus Competibacterales bacterium]